MSVVMKGKVTVKVHGVLKQKQLPGNWAVLYDGGDTREKHPYIELFDQHDSKTPVHTIVLENLKFSEKSYRPGETFFTLSIKKEKHHFQLENKEDKEDWVQSLCHVSPELWKQKASSRERESSEIDSDSIADMSENLLYDSCDRVQQFKVSINPNKTSEANNLRGHYMLNPTKDSLRLLELDGSKTVHEWPYRQIRKFGYTRKFFKIEVGRMCSTGAGELDFFTPDGTNLVELIGIYTRQTFSPEQRNPQLEAASSAPACNSNMESVPSSSTVQQAPAAPVSCQTSQSVRDSKGKGSRESLSGSSSSLDPKREVPIPVPRTSIKSKKENGSTSSSVSEATGSSSDTKIYETSGGLTAPLKSQLKHELDTKLRNQESEDLHAEIEDEPISDTPADSIGARDSSESIKDRKKNEKERKKLEKEQKAAEAKRKKQLEKEQKEREKELREQKEREAKEEKERQKKLKKQSKAPEKKK